MNIFLDYQKKFLVFLKKLKRQKVIDFPNDLNNFTVELPPKALKADISYNAAMVLAKYNQKSPLEIASILKKQLSKNFKEFSKIDLAKPGFININFKVFFWKKYLLDTIKFGVKYGYSKTPKKKI